MDQGVLMELIRDSISIEKVEKHAVADWEAKSSEEITEEIVRPAFSLAQKPRSCPSKFFVRVDMELNESNDEEVKLVAKGCVLVTDSKVEYSETTTDADSNNISLPPMCFAPSKVFDITYNNEKVFCEGVLPAVNEIAQHRSASVLIIDMSLEMTIISCCEELLNLSKSGSVLNLTWCVLGECGTIHDCLRESNATKTQPRIRCHKSKGTFQVDDLLSVRISQANDAAKLVKHVLSSKSTSQSVISIMVNSDPARLQLMFLDPNETQEMKIFNTVLESLEKQIPVVQFHLSRIATLLHAALLGNEYFTCVGNLLCKYMSPQKALQASLTVVNADSTVSVLALVSRLQTTCGGVPKNTESKFERGQVRHADESEFNIEDRSEIIKQIREEASVFKYFCSKHAKQCVDTSFLGDVSNWFSSIVDISEAMVLENQHREESIKYLEDENTIFKEENERLIDNVQDLSNELKEANATIISMRETELAEKEITSVPYETEDFRQLKTELSQTTQKLHDFYMYRNVMEATIVHMQQELNDITAARDVTSKQTEKFKLKAQQEKKLRVQESLNVKELSVKMTLMYHESKQLQQQMQEMELKTDALVNKSKFNKDQLECIKVKCSHLEQENQLLKESSINLEKDLKTRKAQQVSSMHRKLDHANNLIHELIYDDTNARNAIIEPKVSTSKAIDKETFTQSILQAMQDRRKAKQAMEREPEEKVVENIAKQKPFKRLEKPRWGAGPGIRRLHQS